MMNLYFQIGVRCSPQFFVPLIGELKIRDNRIVDMVGRAQRTKAANPVRGPVLIRRHIPRKQVQNYKRSDRTFILFVF